MSCPIHNSATISVPDLQKKKVKMATAPLRVMPRIQGLKGVWSYIDNSVINVINAAVDATKLANSGSQGLYTAMGRYSFVCGLGLSSFIVGWLLSPE